MHPGGRLSFILIRPLWGCHVLLLTIGLRLSTFKTIYLPLLGFCLLCCGFLTVAECDTFAGILGVIISSVVIVSGKFSVCFPKNLSAGKSVLPGTTCF